MRRPGCHCPLITLKSGLQLASAVLAVLLTITACSPNSVRLARDTPTLPSRPTTQSSPYPYTTPLPPPVATDLDGLYAKIDPKLGTPVPCKRCPDYAPEGGTWHLSFDKGTYRVFHVSTGWRSVGSYTVAGNQLTLFNDPVCHDEVGTFTWTVKDGELTLQEAKDRCAIHLRAVNLTRQPWSVCQLPNTEAAVTDYWTKPAGCPDNAMP